MSANSKIEWTTHTLNLWWGCVEDGPECDHCYARSFARRTGNDVWGLGPRRFFGDRPFRDLEKWNAAAEKAGRRERVFIGSMMDIGERRNDDVGLQMNELRAKLWPVIERCDALDFLLLTKRPQNFPALVPAAWMNGGFPWNVWVGTTAGDQPGFDKRVKYLRRLPASTRFVSCEPLLGPITADLDGIHWVIVGGESGVGARPMQLAWMRSLVAQTRAYGAAPFVKQFGDRPFDALAPIKLRTSKGGELSEIPGDWPREFPARKVWEARP